MRPIRLLLTALVLAGAAHSALAQSVGRVLMAVGDVAASRFGRTIALASGTAIESGDQIRTGSASGVQIRFADGSIVSLKPQSVFTVDDYRFAGQDDGNARAFFNLIAGGMRTVTGLIGKVNQRNFALRTPTATVGIRGSGWNTSVCTPSAPCAGGGSAQAPNGTYIWVWDKGVFSDNGGGRQDWDRGDVVYIADSNSPGVRLIQVPEFLASTLTERSRNAGKGDSDTAPTGAGQSAADDGRRTGPPPTPTPVVFVTTETRSSTGTIAVLGNASNVTGFIASYTLPGGSFNAVSSCNGRGGGCNSSEATQFQFQGNQLVSYSGAQQASVNVTGGTISNQQSLSLSDGSTLSVYRLSGSISGTTFSGSPFSNPGAFIVGASDSSLINMNAGLPTSGNFSFGSGAGNSGGLFMDAAGNLATGTMTGTYNAVSRMASFIATGNFANIAGFGPASISTTGGGIIPGGSNSLQGASLSFSCIGTGCQSTTGGGVADVRFIRSAVSIPAMVANGGLFNATRNAASGNTVIFTLGAKCMSGAC